MASENETVAEALEAISELAAKLHDKEKVEKCDIMDVWSIVRQVKNRIEAAHRREVAELKTAYDRAVSADTHHAVENERLKGEVAAIRAKLKVAEDALEAIFGKVQYKGFISPINKAEAAHAAIREEGAEDEGK